MAAKVQVYVGIGSNLDRERYVSAALDALADRFGDIRISPVYESESVGFDGSPFLNLVVGVMSDLSVDELSKCFKALEADNGRRPEAPRFSARTLDLDILTYGSEIGCVEGVELPRGEILKNAFVLWPLADIAPNEVHPVCGKSYGELWRAYRSDQKLWPVNFHWRGNQISFAAS